MNTNLNNVKLQQISNHVFCDEKLNEMNIETKILPNPYYDYPYLIIDNFLGDSLCDEINFYINKKKEFESANLRVRNSINAIDDRLDKKIRNTNLYKLNESLEKIYLQKFNNVQKSIEEYFKLPITSSTDIQALEYKEGCFYKAHSDDSSMIYDGDKLIGFVPIAKKRKITTVFFTGSYGEDFLGGELKFNFLYNKSNENILLKPKKGDLLVFLSNPYFTHEVLPVKSGSRVTLVQWHNCI